MTRKFQKGQSVLLLILALGVFLIGGLGLAIDGSHLYAQRQMAQAAADAAAQAGIMSIFNETNTGANAFGSARRVCSIGDSITPCRYAALNGFGTTAVDTVTLDFPASTTAPAGVPLSATDPVNFIKVTVSRNVNTTLIRAVGASSLANVSATAVAAIVNQLAPIPIVVTHPTLANALSMNGNTHLTILGGPSRAIQVNSRAGLFGSPGPAASPASVDLSGAGPNGTGADFGVYGTPTAAPGSIALGSTGHWTQPASPMRDPLASVNPPLQPANNGTKTTNGCGSGCDLYTPGLYNGGIDVKNRDARFAPGVYYVRNGDFSLKNTTVNMCSTCASSPATGAGMLVYHTGSGAFVVDTNVTAHLLGAGVSTATPPAAPVAPYYGILFFQDRSAAATTHTIGQGNGCLNLQGTLYMTNTLAIMKATPTQYQRMSYNGNPCSNTAVQGEIIAGALELVGSSSLKMSLTPGGYLGIRQVALVN
jgi:hypothetical protein